MSLTKQHPPNAPAKSVFVKPVELFRRPLDVWPIYSGVFVDVTHTKSMNALVRTLIIVLLVLSFYSSFARITLVCLFAYLVTAEVVYQVKEKSMNGESSNLPTPTHPPFQQLVRPDLTKQMNVCADQGNCLPLDNTNLFWDKDALVRRASPAVAPALADPIRNPYGNPLKFNYDAAVRSEPNNVVFSEPGDSLFDRMYQSVGDTPMGLFFNTVPDTTLMASTRGVPMPSLVGDVRALP